MVRGKMLIPRFSIRQFLHREQFSKQPMLLFAPKNVLVCERQLSSSGVLAQRGQQRREDRDEGQRGLSAATILEDEKRGVFRVIDISPAKREERKRFKRFGEDDPVPPPRAASMLPTQRWGDVWPAARTFHPAVVPLPVRQGVTQTKQQTQPGKYANTELMKVVNFLHLTPPVVSQHCAAIAKFCTPWPKGLETEEDVEKHFPLTVVTSDHLHSSSSVRDRRARIVTLSFNVDKLDMDEHARDKFTRLVGDRIDEETGVVTLTADRCPYRGQNMDYAHYLLTALYHESWRVEEWEKKEQADMEVFEVEGDEGQERVALKELLNEGENEERLARYREEVRIKMGLPPLSREAEIVS